MIVKGQLLHGRYQVERVLQEGGMSVVYSAFDTRLETRIAVKQMKDLPLLSEDEKLRAIEQFHLEAKMLAGLSHRGLPRVSDFFHDGISNYLIMDLIQGDSLQRMSDTLKKAMPENLVLLWGYEVCQVLEYLHSRKPPIIFRDLKPSNVMIDLDGHVKLIDFGISKKQEEGQHTRTIIKGAGTPGYAPPEQYGNVGKQRTDTRSDLYSLGATMYALLAWDSPMEVTERYMNDIQDMHVRDVNPNVSEALDAILARMLQLDPNKRPNTVKEVMEVFLRQLDGVPSSEPIAVPPEMIPRDSGTTETPVRASATHAMPSFDTSPDTAEISKPTEGSPTLPHGGLGEATPPPTQPVMPPPPPPPRPKPAPPSFPAVRWGMISAMALAVLLIAVRGLVSTGGEHPVSTMTGQSPTNAATSASPTVSPSPSVSVAPAEVKVPLTTKPGSVHVVVDGKSSLLSNEAGDLVVTLKPGRHELKFNKQYYLSHEQKLQIGDTAPAPLEVTLVAMPVLEVKPSPSSDYSVSDANGKVVEEGSTPKTLHLMPGAYAVALHAAGYYRQTVKVKLEAGKTASVSPELARIPPPPPPPPPPPRWHPTPVATPTIR